MKPLKARKIYGYGKSRELVLFCPQSRAERDKWRQTFTCLKQTLLFEFQEYPDNPNHGIVMLGKIFFFFQIWILIPCVVWLLVSPKQNKIKNDLSFGTKKYLQFLQMTPWEMSLANLTQHTSSATGCFDFALILLAAVFQLETFVAKLRQCGKQDHQMCVPLGGLWNKSLPCNTLMFVPILKIKSCKIHQQRLDSRFLSYGHMSFFPTQQDSCSSVRV